MFWSEGAGDAMRTHVHDVLHPGRTLTTAIADAAGAISIHATRLQDAVTTAVNHIRSATDSGFSVDEDGTVAPPPPVLYDATQTGWSTVIVQMVALRRRADILTRVITADLFQVGSSDSAAAAAVTEAFAKVRRDSGLDPSILAGYESLATADATADGIAARTGNLARGGYQRIGGILIAAGLSPSQLDALARGEAVDTVPSLALSYLREFYREAGTHGVLDIAAALRAQEESGEAGAAARLDALANGLLMVSNENVGDGTSAGGIRFLPADLTESLSRAADPSSEVSQSYAHIVDAVGGRLPEFARFISEANPGFVPGTEFADALDRTASRMVDFVPAVDEHVQFAFDSVAEHLLDIGVRNENASYELLTAADNAQTLMPLFEHEWADDGATLGRMVDWIANDAVVTDPADTTRADRAGEAAYALARVISSSGSATELGLIDSSNTNPYDRLMNIPGVGDGKSSLGEVNPALTQSMAGALSPYVIDMVTDERLMSSTSNFGQLGPIEATRVFSLLDSDPRAGMLISGHALATATEIDCAFARNPTETMMGETSGRLRAVVEGGLDAELGDRLNDTDERKNERAEARAGYFGASQAILATGAGFLPPPWGIAVPGAIYTAGSFSASGIIDADGSLTDEFRESPQARIRLNGSDLSTPTGGVPGSASIMPNEIRYNLLTEVVESDPKSYDWVPEEALHDNSLIPYAELLDLSPKNDSFSDRFDPNVRHVILKELPDRLDHAGIRSADEYIHQHQSAFDAYNVAVFGRSDNQDAFTSRIRENKSSGEMSTWNT